MAVSKVPSPLDLSRPEFDKLLAQYPALIGSLSKQKDAKQGKMTLQQLDDYRYNEALRKFGHKHKGSAEMDLDAVEKLVEWKLQHGKFRPMLMKLVSSNDPDWAKQTIRQAIDKYRTSTDVPAAMSILVKLKGIGPATASLVLTVHDPDRVIFFSDEAFYWLCCSGKKGPIKYNAKEYDQLRAKAQDLMSRLSVRATDVEKVAFVLFKSDGTTAKLLDADPGPSKPLADADAPDAAVAASSSTLPAKRKSKSESTADQGQAGPRRSKRNRT